MFIAPLVFLCHCSRNMILLREGMKLVLHNIVLVHILSPAFNAAVVNDGGLDKIEIISSAACLKKSTFTLGKGIILVIHVTKSTCLTNLVCGK